MTEPRMSEAPHVLIVDDEPRIRTMLHRYLTGEGLKVSDAGDGAAMRAVLEREAIDLVLLDLVMPGEDGLSLARYVRRQVIEAAFHARQWNGLLQTQRLRCGDRGHRLNSDRQTLKEHMRHF